MTGTHVWDVATCEWVPIGSPAAQRYPEAEPRTPGEDHGNGSRTIGLYYAGLGSKRCNVCGWSRSMHADVDDDGVAFDDEDVILPPETAV